MDKQKWVQQMEELDTLSNEDLRDLIGSWRQEKQDLEIAYVEAMEAQDWNSVNSIVYRIDTCDDQLRYIYEILRNRMEG